MRLGRGHGAPQGPLSCSFYRELRALGGRPAGSSDSRELGQRLQGGGISLPLGSRLPAGASLGTLPSEFPPKVPPRPGSLLCCLRGRAGVPGADPGLGTPTPLFLAGCPQATFFAALCLGFPS